MGKLGLDVTAQNDLGDQTLCIVDFGTAIQLGFSVRCVDETVLGTGAALKGQGHEGRP